MIYLYPIQDSIAFIGTFLIGHDDICIIVEISSSCKDKCDNPADRYMAIIISLGVHIKKLRIHSSEHKQSWRSNFITDHFMEIIILTESRSIKWDMELFDKFYADQTILSSSKSDHGHL